MRAVTLFIAALPLTGLLSCSANMPQVLQTGAEVASATGYSNQAQVITGLKAALELSSTRAATQLGQQGGYSNNPLYRIVLPDTVQPLAKNLRQLGLGSQIDRVENLMNQGAEKAATEAAAVFTTAIRNMTVTDALGIARGGDTAATDYFRQQTEASLRQRYSPIIKQSLQQIGFYTQYQQLLTTYNQLPLANKPSLDLEQHVLDQSLNALFKQIGTEEQLLRKDPVGRGSSIIGAVFAR